MVDTRRHIFGYINRTSQCNSDSSTAHNGNPPRTGLGDDHDDCDFDDDDDLSLRILPSGNLHILQSQRWAPYPVVRLSVPGSVQLESSGAPMAKAFAVLRMHSQEHSVWRTRPERALCWNNATQHEDWVGCESHKRALYRTNALTHCEDGAVQLREHKKCVC